MQDYKKHIKSKDFQKVEAFSDAFIEKVGGEIASYNKKWVADPFHQWSRQWEYVYVIQNIAKASKKSKKFKVLDLGSGVTFLPYYLKEETNVTEVVSLDYDETLGPLFKSVDKEMNQETEFRHHDMRKLNKLKPGTYDAIYSVSVLEHTDEYRKIIKDSYKLLKPGGTFCLTFDISLDGRDDIPKEQAEDLINALAETYNSSDVPELDDVLKQQVLTSSKIADMDKSLMPWKYPLVNVFRPLLSQRRLGTRYKKLTVCCLTFKKAR